MLKILIYLCVPIIIGYITTVLTKRKEVEMAVKRDFIARRIEAYVALHSFMRRNSLLIAPPMYQERELFSYLDGTGFIIGDQGMEYVSYFRDFPLLEKHIGELNALVMKYDIYLEPSVKEKTEDMQHWYREVLHLLRGFKETVADPECGLTSDCQKGMVRLATILLGTALQDDINRFSSLIENTLSKKLTHPKLKYWYEKEDDRREHDMFSSSQLATRSEMVGLLLVFAFVSDRYTRDEFDELDDTVKNKIMQEFCRKFVDNLQR